MAPLPPPSGASLAQPFQISGSTQQIAASPMMAVMTVPTANITKNATSTTMLGGYPIICASAQTGLPPAVSVSNNAPSALSTNLANNPSFTTMQGDHGQASSIHSGVNSDILGSSDDCEQEWHSDSASGSYPVEMDVTPIAPNETAAPAPRPTCTTRTRSSRRERLFNRSAKLRGGWSPMNAITAIPPKLANRLKDRFRAEIVAKCKAQHFEECRRDNKAVIEKELERMAKEHAEKLESQRIKAEKAIQEALGERVNELKTIRKLEQAKKVIESEAEMKDQQIRNLQADLQKSMATEANLNNSNATAEIAVRKAQADLKPQENQIPNQRTAKEALKNAAKGITDLRAKNAVLKNAAKEITDLRAENAVLKKQIGDVKGDLKVSTKKVEVLERILIQPPPPTKASHKTKSIRNLKSSVEQLTSIIAEQAQTLANINSTMIDFKNANETLVKELARQRSERAAAEDKAAGLLETFYAERQAKEDLE